MTSKFDVVVVGAGHHLHRSMATLLAARTLCKTVECITIDSLSPLSEQHNRPPRKLKGYDWAIKKGRRIGKGERKAGRGGRWDGPQGRRRS